MLDRLPVKTVKGFADMSITEAEAETMRRHPELASLAPPEMYRVGIELFAGVTAECFMTGLDVVLDDFSPDVVVFDVLAVGAALAAAQRDVPRVCVDVVQWSFFTETLHKIAIERNDIDGNGNLAAAYLELFPTSMRPEAGRLPRNTHSLRPVSASTRDATLPAWLAAPKERTRVYLTLGTVSFGATHAIEAALDVLEAHDVDVLVAVGPQGDPSKLRRRGDRVHFERFVDQSTVLTRVDAVVHHGGSGTMLSTLALGHPQVLMPQGADQFQNAALLSATGAGRAVLPGPVENELADAIEAALTDRRMREAATRMASEIGAMPSPDAVAASLADLVG
jgi:hypothetical protein